MIRRVLLILVLAGMPGTLKAQALAIAVRDAESGLPLPEANARSMSEVHAVSADRLGRIHFANILRPSTIVVRSMGFRPETLTVAEGAAEIEVSLQRRPIGLADVTISAGADGDLTPAATGQWVLTRDAMRFVPPAIESDPLRALAVLPSVSFSSPLSARPVIRGYDAAENVTRLNGFELVNPFHIGRVFAAIPAEFTRAVEVAVTPHRVTDAEALAGVVDLVGLAGPAAASRNGGFDLSLVSATAWHGWRGSVPGFAGARVASFGVVSDIAGDRVGYDFRDGYARLAVPLPGRRRSDLTLYGASDDLGDAALNGAMWSNVLVGQRTRLVDRSSFVLDVSASFNRFELVGRDIEARFTRLDIYNRFDRTRVDLDGHGALGRVTWSAGAGYGQRKVRNEIAPRFGHDFPSTASRATLNEWRGFAAVTALFGRATVTVGARIDGASRVTAVQPRSRLAVSLAPGAVVAMSVARSSRLYQVVTDPQPEPSLAFYDFWMTAGDAGVPVPRIDHVAGELDLTRGHWAVHAGFYGSRGAGLGELRPESDLRDTTAFRFGDSRTAGLELRLARGSRRQGGPSAAVSYALAWSQRRWDDAVWRPWRLDQRHRLRLQANAPFSSRWQIFALAEVRSPQPLVRVAELYFTPSTAMPGDSLEGRPLVPGYLYSPEGSARGQLTAWFDLSTRVRIDGPWGFRSELGIAVTNLAYGPVAPLEPVSPAEAALAARAAPLGLGGVPYHRRFTLPPVPSVTLRVTF